MGIRIKRRGYSIYQKRPGGSWYVAWTDGMGRRRIDKASTNKAVAHEIGHAKAAEADRVRSGVVTAKESGAKDAANLDINLVLDAWEADLKAKRRTARYVAMERARVQRLFEACGIKCLAEMKREKVQGALLKISEAHTPQTANHYRTAVRMFSRWCTDTDRTASDQVYGVKILAAHGQTFRRTPISGKQLIQLVEATEKRQCKSPVKGPDRAMYYLLMAYTGFRKSEAASLTPESFKLTPMATVTVDAAYSKRRRRDEQIIPPDLARELKHWLRDKPAGEPVFPFGPHWQIEQIFRDDCASAGIMPADGERLGVHSLRRFYITSVVRAGGLAVAQQMARHSTPALTASYADLDDADRRRGLRGLPKIKRRERMG